METQFEKSTMKKRFLSMLKVDATRMVTMPLVYIMAGISFLLPILILVMTTLVGAPEADPTAGENAAVAFTNVWQTLGAVSGTAAGMDLTSMCNINMLYFLVAVFVCIYVADDFKSGYAKNLFTVRSDKKDYILSKTLVTFVGAAIMFMLYFAGAMIGGAIAGLAFDTAGFSAGGIAACLFAKIFLTAIFVAIALLLGTVAKQKLWLSIVGSIAAGMLLYMMIPIAAPLDANFLHVLLCFVGGGLFAAGLGAVGNVILNKTSLV